MATSLKIDTLHASIDEKEILKGLSLEIKPGEIHAIMGPNGSGKSTTAAVLAGHPDYEVKSGNVTLDGSYLLDLSPDERAQRGLFLAFQYPVAVPGVKVEIFLRKAHQARFSAQPEKQFAKAIDFRRYLQELARELDINEEFLKRGLNENFSGGEKKQLEILQMAVLEPTYAILDETDSGLDIDAIKKVSAGINKIHSKFKTGLLIITHYKRILDYVKPDFVHVMVDGAIVRNGGTELIDQLEREGYAEWQGKEKKS